MNFKKILKILVIDSIGDLFKYNTFFILICFLMLLDKIVKKIAPKRGLDFIQKERLESIDKINTIVFQELPDAVLNIISDPRFFMVVAVLFLFKQLTSLWPSSDMRLMHRDERKFGFIFSLFSLKWQKILWDGFAVSFLCISALLWSLVSFFISKFFYLSFDNIFSLILFGVLIIPVLPLTMAGLSYSSKIAVIDKGSFKDKFNLFIKLFTDFKIFFFSLIFYISRAGIEIAFVGVIPFFILIAMDITWLKITLALFIATPVYSFLKMASFKFFLFIYKDNELIKEEYSNYYKKIFND